MDKNSKVFFAIILVISTFLGGLGQFLFKLGLNSVSITYLSILVCLGIISYIVSTVFYFYALSRAHLSWVYSFGGLSYIFANIFALFFLSEIITPLRWLGVIIIAIGTALIGLS